MEFPIENQEQFDEAIKKRLTKERQKWEDEKGSASGEGEGANELEEARSRVAELQGEIRSRDARSVLASMNVTDQKRQDRIIRLADLDEAEDAKAMQGAFKAVYEDMPEVFGENAQVKDKGLDTSQAAAVADAPITSQEQIDANENAEPGWIERNWDTKVAPFLERSR